MTDARLPDQWLGDPRFDCWYPETWKFFIDCLMWSNRYLTDGRIPMKHALNLSMGLDLEQLVSQIESSGMCTSDKHFIYLEWTVQSTKEEVESRRNTNKVKQQRFRDRRKDELEEYRSGSQIENEGYVTSYGSSYVGQDRLGQDDTF